LTCARRLDAFPVVKVDEEHSECHRAAGVGGDGVIGAFVKEGPVREPGQRIMQNEVLHVILAFAELDLDRDGRARPPHTLEPVPRTG
jgi:hypothetical protein